MNRSIEGFFLGACLAILLLGEFVGNRASLGICFLRENHTKVDSFQELFWMVNVYIHLQHCSVSEPYNFQDLI